MKVLVIGFGKIYIMTYMHFYLEQLKKKGCDIHLIYWNRDGQPDIPVPPGVTPHPFECPIETGIPRWRKLSAFWGFRTWCKKIIETGDFDLAVVLTTPPGIILLDLLNKHFPKKYIFDFRDITSENLWVFRQLVNRLIAQSAATFVSSNAFRAYLRGDGIYTSHNLLPSCLEHRHVRKDHPRTVSPIRIRYWGMIRHEAINKQIIDRLANDDRFELHYHGCEFGNARNLKQHCLDIGARNVFMHGVYAPDERYEFAKDTDLLHNLFENDKTMQPAMANKFYDGIALYIPQLCTHGSYMGHQVTEHAIGLACHPDSPAFADELFHYYNAIPWGDFETRCDQVLAGVMSEYEGGIHRINDLLDRHESRPRQDSKSG
jgi:hypothetical protein